MRRLRRRMTAVLTALLLLTLLIPWGLAEPAPGPHQTTVLFTHDLHSHFLPLERADGGESGGYARLASALEQQRALHPDALTLDGGDFSIGSLVQTLYTTRAAELRTMGALGYDATTAGNHEFDHTGLGFAQMLTAAYTSGDPLPALLMANYAPSAGGPDQLDIQRAMSAYGVTDTLLLERGGVTYGIFGLMGTDSDDCAPTSGFTLEDPVQAAQLYMSGMVYTFNPHRMFFNRVTSCWLEEPSFATGLLEREMSRIEDDQLYRVVTGMYSAQMLGTVKEKSLGLLSLEPKDENGVPITDFATRVLRDGNGSEIKEWYALAAYLQSFWDEGVPERYGMPKGDGRKSVDRSWNPIELLRSPNWITLVTLLAAAAVLAAAVLLVRALVRRVRRRRYGGGRKRYRG